MVAPRSYLVCSVQQAGSRLLLRHVLEDTGALGRPSRHSSTGMPGVRSQVNPVWAGSRDELNGTATIAARAAGGGMT